MQLPPPEVSIEGRMRPRPSNVLVYGDVELTDTIHKVYTEPLMLAELSETTTVEVKIRKIPGVRIMPSVVSVTVPVEPLVKKEALITITPVNVPRGKSLLLFPSKVPVEYYVAMSRLDDDDDPSIEVYADYNSINDASDGKINVRVIDNSESIQKSFIESDVEFTLSGIEKDAQSHVERKSHHRNNRGIGSGKSVVPEYFVSRVFPSATG